MKVFLSSTYIDLIEYRKSTIQYFKELSSELSGMEVWGASNNNPLDVCLERVKESDLYVGIIGHRYGSLDSTSGKSITELEYLTAIENDINCLILVMTDDCSIQAKFIDKGERFIKLNEFKEVLKESHFISYFDSSEDFLVKLDASFRNYTRDNNIKLDNFSIDSLSYRVSQASKENYMPDDIKLEIGDISSPHEYIEEVLDTIEGIRFFHEAINNSYKEMDEDVTKILIELGVDSTIAESYFESPDNSFDYRDWELRTFFPNRLMIMEKACWIIKLNLLQFEARTSRWNGELSKEIEEVTMKIEDMARHSGYID